MKQMLDPFTSIKISKNPSAKDTEYILKEKDGSPRQFSIEIQNNLISTDKIVFLNAEKFLTSSTLRNSSTTSHNTKTVDFAIIDFRSIESEDNEITIYLIELGNHSTHQLKLKYNSTFSILTAFISKYLQLTKLNPDDHFKFKCAYRLIHVIESELKQGMISDESKNIKMYKHNKYDFHIIEVNQINHSCQFSDLEHLPKKHMVLESLNVK